MTYSLAIHGGAGVIPREKLTKELRESYEKGLSDALRSGQKILQDGGSAVDAIESAVKSLEDCPLFNAGTGAVLNDRGEVEMDAAIMDGVSRGFGAVGAVREVKNPILLARQVMSQTPHRLIVGKAADELGRANGLEVQAQIAFITEMRRQQWEKAQETGRIQLDHGGDAPSKMGTVGAVAVDLRGRLAAATSTGGMVNKMGGRIGDTPILGAGTYADGRCAISCTGIGEIIIDHLVAYRIASLIELLGCSLEDACRRVILTEMDENSAGIIAISRNGSIVMVMNTVGMFRGIVSETGAVSVGIFADEAPTVLCLSTKA